MTQFIENDLHEADKFLQIGEITKAEDIYNNVLKKYPENLCANKSIKNINRFRKKWKHKSSKE